MELEDFFGNKKKHHRTQKMKNYYREESYKPYSQKGSYDKLNLLGLLNRVKNNRKLKIYILVFLIILVTIIVGILALLFPLIMELFNYLSQNGISGIIEKAMEILNTLWTGAN